MSFFSFAFSKDGRKHLLRIGLVYAALIAVLWIFLRWYSDHGEQVSVPDLHGMTLEEAATVLGERELGYTVVDSIYDENARAGSIVDQSPAPEQKVKEGRQVFLTVYRFQPPMETISIEEGEFAQVAIIKLKNKGIRYDIRYVPNNNMVGSVVSLTYKGRKLRKGDTLPRGERVVLTVGESADQSVTIPNLRGMTFAAAMALLDSTNLMGQGFFEPEATSAQDSGLYRVCRQDPPFDPEAPPVPPGRIVDFWLSREPCSPADSTQIP